MALTVRDVMETDTPSVRETDSMRLRKATAATAEDLMTRDPVTVEADAAVHEAARLIAAKKHNRLPVVEHGRLVGVVTRLDVLAALVED